MYGINLFSYSFKWVGGGAGWYFGGPLGGVSGFIAGTVIDSLFLKKEEKRITGAVSTSVLMLIASVINAKAQPATDLKIRLVKQFITLHYGKKNTDLALSQLSEILKQKIMLNDACEKLRYSLDYSSRLQLVQFFYKIAKVDGKLTDNEQFILNIITEGLDVIQSVRPVIAINDAIIKAYEILGVNHNTTVIDVKKSYRRLAFAYHPDKVAHLGEEQKKIANEKFNVLTKAYNVIKKERNFT